MGRELKVECDSGTPYIALRNENDEVFYIAGQVYEEWGMGGRDADDYDVELTNRGGSRWSADMPAGVPAGRPTRQAFLRAGDVPVDGDPFLGSNVIVWSGSAETIELAAIKAETDKIVLVTAGSPSEWGHGSLGDEICNKDSNRTYQPATDALEALRDQMGTAGAGFTNLGGMPIARLYQAVKTLLNKAIQAKATGVIDYYDDDGETKILTQTPTDSESDITRTPS